MTQTTYRFDTIPEELTKRRQWLAWSYETGTKGEQQKIPKQTTGANARVNDPSTWTTFTKALNAADQFEGIGFVITAEDPYCGLDFDNCLDDGGNLRDWAVPIVAKLCDVAYGELSPSGSGIKFLTHGAKTDGSGTVKQFGDDKQQLEVYDGTNRKTGKPGHRWWAMTGDAYEPSGGIGDGREAISQICAEYLMPERSSKPPETPPNARNGNGSSKESASGPMSVEERAARYVAKMDPSISGERGHDRCYAAACALVIGFDLAPETALGILKREFNPRCDPPWSDYELEHKVTDADAETGTRGELRDKPLEDPFAKIFGTNKTTSGAANNAAASELPVGWLGEIQHQTENFVARQFIAANRDQLRFVPRWGKWLAWDGRRWEVDAGTVRTMGLMQEFADGLWIQLGVISKESQDPKQIAKVASLIKSLNSTRCIEAVIRLARTSKLIVADHGTLNQHPYRLNVRNGTYCLETFQLLPHDPADLITQLAPVSFNADAQCPKWIETISYAMGGDAEMVDYLQRLLGYMITADTGEHILPIFYGTGSNGKSTIWNTLVLLLGEDEYARVASDALLLGYHDDHQTSKADLFASRLVIVPEPSAGAPLKESRMKEMTGDGFISARRMREDMWTFRRTFSLLIATNYLPKISGTDDGVWRRVRKVLFGQSFKEKEGGEIKKMPEYFYENEGPGILNWLIEGWRQYDEAGRQFNEPITVIAEIKDYRSEEDPIGEFYAECICAEEGAEVLSRRIHTAYRLWCENNGIPPKERLGNAKFKSAMVARGAEYRKAPAGPNKDRICCYGIVPKQ